MQQGLWKRISISQIRTSVLESKECFSGMTPRWSSGQILTGREGVGPDEQWFPSISFLPTWLASMPLQRTPKTGRIGKCEWADLPTCPHVSLSSRLTALYPVEGGKADVHQLESFRPIDFSFLGPDNFKSNSSKVWQDIELAAALEKQIQQEKKKKQPKGHGDTSHRTQDNIRITKPQDNGHKKPHHHDKKLHHSDKRPQHIDQAHQKLPTTSHHNKHKKAEHASDHAPHKPPPSTKHAHPKTQYHSDHIHKKTPHHSPSHCPHWWWGFIYF